MDLDRTSLSDRAQDLRTRPQKQPEPSERPADSPAPVAPEHGGPLASSRVENESQTKRDPDPDARRQTAYDAIARHLRLPGETELDIQVDVEERKVTFQIRDRRTGELLRSVPEDDAGSLVDKLREFAGSLIDRRF